MALPFRTFGVLLLTVFLDLLAFGMVIPILPLYALELHATPREIGLLVSVYSAMQLFFSPILGRLSDRFGRRPVMLLSILGSMLSQLGYSQVTSIGGLLLARALAGACGANISAAQAYIADVTDEKSRTPAMGMLGAALGLGFIFGPTLGGLLGGQGSASLPFLVAAGLSAVNLVWAIFALREPLPAAERRASRALRWSSLRETLAQPRLRVLLVLFFLITLGFTEFEATFSIFAADRFHYGRREASYLFAFIGVNMVIAQGVLVRRLVPRIGEARMMVIGVGLMALGLTSLAYTNHVVQLCIALGILALGMGLQSPSLSSLISKRAGGLQGSVLGVSQSFGSLARIIGPLIGGFLLEQGVHVPIVAGGALLFMATLLIAIAIDRPTESA